MIYSLGNLHPNFNKDTVWVADSADVIGNVVMEDDVSVWFNVTIRGDNDEIKVCKGANIQDNSVIHTCLLYTSPSPRDQRGSRMPSSA